MREREREVQPPSAEGEGGRELSRQLRAKCASQGRQAWRSLNSCPFHPSSVPRRKTRAWGCRWLFPGLLSANHSAPGLIENADNTPNERKAFRVWGAQDFEPTGGFRV